MDRNEKIALFRQRFFGRQDVYGRGWTTYRDGKQIKGFSPACTNFYTPGCHIKLKDGTPCSKCEIKKYEQLTDDRISDHISGVSPILNYLLQEDGTVHFAALDFDMKPGKEKLGHTLEDVMRVSELLSKINIPHGIARSTGLGHHLYTFFSTPVDAFKIRSVFYWVFEKVGFISEVEAAIRPLPEMFPKQGSSEGGLGNGIKPPMIEPNFVNERNCFITNIDQWEYLKNIPTISREQLDEIITKEGIELQEDSRDRTYTAKNSWTPPTTGAIQKVLEGCAAFKRLKTKCEANEVLTHDEGFSLWHMCINIADGEEWFLNSVPGWGKTEADLKQLQQSKDKNYKPWSCKTMQDKSICIKGTKCFDKRPPMIVNNGVVQEDTSIPESDWPSPSPYRYAVSRSEVSLSKLLAYIDELASQADISVKRSRVKEVISQSMVLDEEQQSALKDKIEEAGIFKKSQLNKQFTTAKKEQEEKVQEELSNRTDTILAGSVMYKRSVQPYGYEKLKGMANEEDILIPLTNFVLDILEERVFLEDDGTTCRWYVGKFKNDEAEISFEIEASSWSNTQMFESYFNNLCGSRWVISRRDIDELRLIAMAAANKDMYQKPRVVQMQYCNSPGWHGQSYITPSIIIDSDSVRPNVEIPVNLSHKEHSRQLDFSMLESNDLATLLIHIKTDLFTAFPISCVQHAIGFTMMASIVRHLDLPYTPTLWFEGESGAGKTALCMLMQKFYGDFKGPLNWGTTYASMVSYGYEFKDSLLLVDDYKEYGNGFKSQICQQIVQSAYQYSARGTSNRDGKQRETKSSRCMFIMTGEETPINETSFIARLLLIYYPKLDTELTKGVYLKCVENSHKYRGITPMFIKYVLNLDAKSIKEKFRALQMELRIGKEVEGNSDRITYNIALARLGWALFLNFMKENGALTAKEEEMYNAECLASSLGIQANMMIRCQEEKNSFIFVNKLKELLHSGMFSIQGLPPFDLGQVRVGFVDPDDKCVGYLYPSILIDEIKKRTSSALSLNQAAISAQLKTLNILITGPSTNTVQKRVGSSTVRVWRVDLVQMGLSMGSPKLVKSDTPRTCTEEGLLLNEDGIA